jgi:hypothetical protein
MERIIPEARIFLPERMNWGELRLCHGYALSSVMFVDGKNTKVTAWLVERIGVACVCVVFFFIWLSRSRRQTAQNRRLGGRPYPMRRYFMETTALARVLFLMSMASILKLK